MPELERDLREVGRLLAFPPEPELVPAVRTRLGEAPRPVPFVARRRVLVPALPALVVAVGAALAVPQTRLEPLLVNDHNGMWIQGAPHVVMYFDSKGRGYDKNVRIAGNVLVWASGSVTLRIEGPITRAEALALAATVR